MSPFEALYGRRCRIPLCWQEIDEAFTIRPELIQATTHTVRVIQEGMKAEESHQKSYVDKRRKPLKFEDRDQVFLRVSPTKGIMRFGQSSKLTPRYIDP